MTQQDGETREIDGCVYKVYMLHPMLSHDLLMDVAKMVGPALGPLFDGQAAEQKGTTNDELVRNTFTKASAALFSGLDKSIVNKVITAFRAVTHVDGKKLEDQDNFVNQFKGKLHNMYAWIAFGMMVQWGKCLSALVSLKKDQGAGTTEGAE